jgi:L-iditol 2-dehydrogenase
MQQAFVAAPNQPVAIRTVLVPDPGPAEALIRVHVATVCAMTDLNTVRGDHPPHGSAVRGMLPHDLRRQLGRSATDVSEPFYPPRAFTEPAFPSAMGHEAAGSVVALGSRANQPDGLVFPDAPLRVGDRVTTNRVHGGYGEYAVVGTDNLLKVPDFMTDEEASLMEPLVANYNCLRRCWSIREPEAVLVVGQGCQGLLATQVVRALGARRVVVSEPSAYKRKLALQVGADAALDPRSSSVVEEADRLTAGHGFDLLVECVGSEATIRAMPFLVRRGGMVAQISAVTRPVTFDYGYVHFKHFIIVPCDYFVSYREVSGQLRELLQLVESGAIDLRSLVTHRFGLDQIASAFDLLEQGPPEVVKVAIYPDWNRMTMLTGASPDRVAMGGAEQGAGG